MIENMNSEIAVILIAVAVMAALVGFMIGKFFGNSRKEIVALRQEVTQSNQELRRYRKKVKAHLDRTAGLFVTMAGSYKELYDHLSQTYEQLAQDDAKNLFKAHLAQLMLSGSENKPLKQDDVHDNVDTVRTGPHSGQPVSVPVNILPEGNGELSATGADLSAIQSERTEKEKNIPVEDETKAEESSVIMMDTAVSAADAPVTAEKADATAAETAVSSPVLSDITEKTENSGRVGKV